MAEAKTVAETVDLPKGLDVIPTVPGTFVGGHDVQGADGKKRTDRPGEILGTSATVTTAHNKTARELELDRTDFVAKEVDRANREDLPRLGGPGATDNWEPIEGGPPSAIAGAKIIGPKADNK